MQANSNNITIAGKACGKSRNVDTNLVHLPSCQMIRYRPIPLPTKLDFNHNVYRSDVKPYSNY